MVSAHGAVADTAPWHRAGGIGEGDGWLLCQRLQVTALGSPGVWAENKRLSVPAARMWGDTTRGDDEGGGLMSPPAPALPFQPQPPARRRHSTPGTFCYVFARGPSATASPLRNPVNDPWIRAGKIHRPRSAPLRARTRTRRLGRWRKPPPAFPRRRKVGSAGMEMAVKLILRGR